MNMATQSVAHGDDETIEQEVQRKGKTAPRVSLGHIESVIVSDHYFTAHDGALGSWPGFGEQPDTPYALSLLTFCVLVLRNGFTVTGESACVSAENFDAEIGRKIARQNAVQKIWALEGYLLKTRLHEAAN